MSSSNAPYLEQAAYIDAVRILQDTQPIPPLEAASAGTLPTQPFTTGSTTGSLDLDSIGQGELRSSEWLKPLDLSRHPVEAAKLVSLEHKALGYRRLKAPSPLRHRQRLLDTRRVA